MVRELQEVSANAWPASVVQMVGGWLLRATPDVRARRSNSVLPQGDTLRIPLGERLALVDDLYARHRIPVRYQISTAATPRELDGILDRQGFEIEAPVLVETAPLEELMSGTPRSGSVASASPPIHQPPGSRHGRPSSNEGTRR